MTHVFCSRHLLCNTKCKGFSEIIGALQNSSEHTKEMFIAMTDVFSFRLDDGP